MTHPKQKKCAVCGGKFAQWNSLHKACSPRCALELGRKMLQRKADQERKAWVRKKKAELKPRSKVLKEAQAEFNRFIRLRDRDRPCISCGSYTAGQYHAGHYRTTKAAPELRFEELNCHKQCAQCNNFDSGNIVEYRISLIQRIGQEAVDWLESAHKPKRYSTEDLERIKSYYRAASRRLQREVA